VFRSYLFPKEEKIIKEYFPPPPARCLIGAAGGGREALALAGMGYEVLAFEPVPQLALALAGRKVSNMRVYCARYEEMPRLFPSCPKSQGRKPRSRTTLRCRHPWLGQLLPSEN
jgi:hypothetical protein